MNAKLDQPHLDRSNTWWRLLIPVGAPLLTALLATGCNPAGTPAADSEPAGNYALVSVNSSNVPCALNHNGHTLTIKSGAFTIGTNGTCVSKMSFTTPAGADASREVKATFTRNGAMLTMKWEGAGTTLGSVKGDMFTMTNEGMALTYRRNAR